jgi:DNA repair protein RecN (Recombination protein N)
MLLELRVQNLLLIESAELRLGPGLNVITGETGAGKTVLAHALDLLMGGKPRSGIVRPGAEESYVEGAFEVDGEEVVLGRRVAASGRSRAFLDGRTATIDDLRASSRSMDSTSTASSRCRRRSSRCSTRSAGKRSSRSGPSTPPPTRV